MIDLACWAEMDADDLVVVCLRFLDSVVMVAPTEMDLVDRWGLTDLLLEVAGCVACGSDDREDVGEDGEQ